MREHIHVTAEIEFENGGLLKGTGDSDGELKIEFAAVDIQVSEGFSYRGEVIISPLGLFDLIHESPLSDCTNIPPLAREIIPATLD